MRKLLFVAVILAESSGHATGRFERVENLVRELEASF
jgi:hypothetical protein